MTEMNYAAIDIGSNAARLLVKRIEENEGQAKFTKELLLRVLSAWVLMCSARERFRKSVKRT